MRPSRVNSPTRPVDLGWLFLLPGIVLIAAAVLIAAEDDLYAARFRRDEAVAIERRHAERVSRYEAYLDAVRRRDPTVVRSLVAGQLNATPTDLVEEHLPGVLVYDSTEVFASLEPPEAEPASRQRVDSVLARWATDDHSRVWLMASGALCVFVGLLPPVGGRRSTAAAILDDQAETEAPIGDGPEDESATELEELADEVDDADDADDDQAEPEADSEECALDVEVDEVEVDEEADDGIEDEADGATAEDEQEFEDEEVDEAADEAGQEIEDGAGGEMRQLDLIQGPEESDGASGRGPTVPA